jgi:nicotinate dehydrogenase subunit B
MSEKIHAEVLFEPERYELAGRPSYHFEWSRRQFFKGLGGGILVISVVTDGLALQESGRRRGPDEAMPSEIGAWLHIAEDGTVTVYTGKVEVGQDIRTSLTQVVAEELRLSLSAIHLVMGDTDLTPFDMGTFGSMTTPVMAAHLRKVSAAAREALLDRAAEQSKADRGSFIVSDGKVIHAGSQQSFTFGQLTKGRELLKLVGEHVPTTPPDQWKVAGKAAARVSGRLIVTGKHRYASDLKRPEMLVGKILRPPAFGATLNSLVTRDAESIAGVRVVRDGTFVGITSPSEAVALQALKGLRAEWKTVPQPSSPELFKILKTQVVGQQDVDDRSNYTFGSIEKGMAAAQVKLRQSYTVAYIAHAPLEPRAAVAEWKNGKLTVWTGTQRPFGVRTELAEAFRVPETQIRVMVPDTGAAYGGKHTGEVAIEAARLAKAAEKPVRLVWTREEEFTWSYFRPAGVIEVGSGARKDGVITAWEFHNYNSGASAIRTPYDIPHQQIEFHRASSPLRQGSYRALAATANHFAREMHMDELARALSIDPLEFRRKNLKDTRLRAVLDEAARAFGWGRGKTPPGHGAGIACGLEKGGYVATCAEVSVDHPSGKISLTRVTTAFECGAIVNPDNLKNQIEGAIIQGIGGALFEAIEFENGKIFNPRFSRYRVPRFSDVPKSETILMNRQDLPSAGAGETPIVALAPAVGNAIFDATGTRLRSLPMIPS